MLLAVVLWFAFCNLLTTKCKQMANQKGDTEIPFSVKGFKLWIERYPYWAIGSMVVGYILSKVLTYLGVW